MPRILPALRKPDAGAPGRGGFLRQTGFEIRAADGNLSGGRAGRLAHFPDRDVQLARWKTGFAQARSAPSCRDCGPIAKFFSPTIINRTPPARSIHRRLTKRPFSRSTAWVNGRLPPSAMAVASEIRMLKELRFPHSLGLVYSAFTDYCGFRINSGEYKLMGSRPTANRNTPTPSAVNCWI